MKYTTEDIEKIVTESLPAWECGLKFITVFESLCCGLSLPAWECGLKSKMLLNSPAATPSLPAWECGLKFFKLKASLGGNFVTPCVGVWIEIHLRVRYLVPHIRHSLRGSVD